MLGATGIADMMANGKGQWRPLAVAAVVKVHRTYWACCEAQAAWQTLTLEKLLSSPVPLVTIDAKFTFSHQFDC